MICSQCGLYISDPSAQACPRCGQFLSNRPDSAFGGAPTPSDPWYSGSQPSQPGYQTPAPGYQTPTPGYQAPGASQWMQPSLAPTYPTPVRRSSRKRRTIVAVLVAFIIVFACFGVSYAVYVARNHPISGNLPGSNVLFSDSLTSDNGNWSTETPHCFYQSNAYHIKNNYICYSPAGDISDAVVTVQVEQVAGSTLYPYGIVFRRVSTGNWYEFDIDSNSKWLFSKSVNGTNTTLVDYTPNAAIKGGLNSSNTLRVEIKGSHFVFFVNGTQVGEADDSTFASGKVGLSANGTSTEVAYTNFEIDKVS